MITLLGGREQIIGVHKEPSTVTGTKQLFNKFSCPLIIYPFVFEYDATPNATRNHRLKKMLTFFPGLRTPREGNFYTLPYVSLCPIHRVLNSLEALYVTS